MGRREGSVVDIVAEEDSTVDIVAGRGNSLGKEIEVEATTAEVETASRSGDGQQ